MSMLQHIRTKCCIVEWRIGRVAGLSLPELRSTSQALVRGLRSISNVLYCKDLTYVRDGGLAQMVSSPKIQMVLSTERRDLLAEFLARVQGMKMSAARAGSRRPIVERERGQQLHIKRDKLLGQILTGGTTHSNNSPWILADPTEMKLTSNTGTVFPAKDLGSLMSQFNEKRTGETSAKVELLDTFPTGQQDNIQLKPYLYINTNDLPKGLSTWLQPFSETTTEEEKQRLDLLLHGFNGF
ncbi:Mss18p KNAG_0A07785 [Huiozyma naganishii CBS 8797]|uniref:Uncharacterized protein n=1 Tax=Huiozyma naganishii (strain ATCC MYA-139 / BCRC 22969 / CBS 8797 / KCTC 17520 / NBRC 10181 / NCYC 3082 / Yp74L-3) TaxID=1071383 RepID=J7S479_HUIN7|nr:hypothetical protein KNAG_0A07785 [Kazachstania naganishii CBS 8797]CCK68431.1 hypothetical protein KNAG_0A07785 [Kazachstania naganishii CBS 8797]